MKLEYGDVYVCVWGRGCGGGSGVGLRGWECNRGKGRLPGHRPIKDTGSQKGDL